MTSGQPASPAGATPLSSPVQGSSAARKVTAVFSTKVVVFGLALATTIIVSRILGTTGKGAYVAVVALPGMLGAVGVFGLPGAINYFSARGTSVASLLRASIILSVIVSAITMAIVWVSLPWLEGSILRAAPDNLLRVIVLAVPPNTLSTFGASILYGRQKVKTYTSILVAQAVATLVLSVSLVGIFRFGVPGAVAASLTVLWLLAIAVVVAVWRLAGDSPSGDRVSYKALISYGLRFIPANITGYFNYRVDTYIIQAVMIGSQKVLQRALGLYSLAVTMAELIFYIPDSVAMIFLPRVVGGSKEQADEMLPRVARLTVLLAVCCALALIPVAWVGVHLVLPSFVPCLPSFLVLLPAVISISVAKVMTSYLVGRAQPGRVSVAATIALALNIAANIVLIPRYGIVGAATASVISYTASAVMMLALACRLSRTSPLALIVPGRAEVRVVVAGVRGGVAEVRAMAAGRVRRGPKDGPGPSDPVPTEERP